MAAKYAKDIDDPRKDIFSALACGRRILILELLKEGEKCACDLIPILGIDQSAVSRHLSILKKAGILKSRKQGVNVYYSVADDRVYDLINIVGDMVRDRNLKLLEKLK